MGAGAEGGEGTGTPNAETTGKADAETTETTGKADALYGNDRVKKNKQNTRNKKKPGPAPGTCAMAQ